MDEQPHTALLEEVGVGADAHNGEMVNARCQCRQPQASGGWRPLNSIRSAT